jgi:ribosomal protein L37E
MKHTTAAKLATQFVMENKENSMTEKECTRCGDEKYNLNWDQDFAGNWYCSAHCYLAHYPEEFNDGLADDQEN